MARIPPVNYEDADRATQAAFDQITSAHGRMTNMKATLAHSLPALEALMQWYPLRDEVEKFLEPRDVAFRPCDLVGDGLLDLLDVFSTIIDRRRRESRPISR